MSANRSYRIHTEVNKDKVLNVNLTQDFDTLDILSLKINTENSYKLHSSKYGCLVGRVLANAGVGIPNVKISVFIAVEGEDLEDPVLAYLYPYNNTRSKNKEGIRYNLLPDIVHEKCHQDIGTFPNKRLVLDDNNVLEVYDKYYKFTTTTNAAGDYMIFGLPTGNNIIHTELDLSDIGILSQKPRDLFYKGYNKTQFENSSQFNKGTNLDSLTQVISQDDSVYVYPFWGDDDFVTEGSESQIKVTRNDINISYKFEPTCIFIGSIVSDEKSQGFSKRCVPTQRMGKMDRLTTGEGTIEMIRKTPNGEVESFSVQGNSLIDGNGTWCYQIPMNLDYIKTDEYGNIVPAENETVGIPTRTRVRFRVSLADYESDSANAHLVKILVPNNPDNATSNADVDYTFGSFTKEESFRDLTWGNVYTVKEYIPRIQRAVTGPKSFLLNRNKNFSGIKAVNVNGSNNPIPYNNIRVQFTFLFMFQCIIFKSLVLIVKIINAIVYVIMLFTSGCGCGNKKGKSEDPNSESGNSNSCHAQDTIRYVTLDGAMCPETDGWMMAFGAKASRDGKGKKAKLIDNTCQWAGQGNEQVSTTPPDAGQGSDTQQGVSVTTDSPKVQTDGPYATDPKSADGKYYETIPDVRVSAKEDFFVKCVELQFAMEYEVIQFDFYNDWLNGCLYIPRWFAELRKRRRGSKIIACDNNFNRNTMFMIQQCALRYNINGETQTLQPGYEQSCGNGTVKCHKQYGRDGLSIMGGGQGGAVRYVQNLDGKYLYYLRPQEYYQNQKVCNLFATDIVLLGNVNECNIYGIPEADGYPSSSFVMPPPTIQIESDSQEPEINSVTDPDFIGHNEHRFYIFNSFTNNGGVQDKELSGIDWGYNPFRDDNVTKGVENQRAGHFLEIGCVNAMTNTKSCINLQRICELGAEMSQSHYVNDNTVRHTTGIVGNREIIGNSIRTKFATLNSKHLFVDDVDKRYRYEGMIPNSFDGVLSFYKEKENQDEDMRTFNNDFIDTKSKSYLMFRLGVDSLEQKALENCFSVRPDNNHMWMPIYANSFYFYFGLKDGNTAIDRLYNEYFSPCTSEEVETIDTTEG